MAAWVLCVSSFRLAVVLGVCGELFLSVRQGERVLDLSAFFRVLALLVFVDTYIRFVTSNNTPCEWGACFSLGSTWELVLGRNWRFFIGRSSLCGSGVLLAQPCAGVGAV